MKFWDASAVVPLLVAEPATSGLRAILKQDRTMMVWWGTPTECISALARLERDDALDAHSFDRAQARLNQLTKGWHEVDPSDDVRDAAARFLRVHPLRAADSLQLAAAYLAAERRPASLEMVTLDERLAAAARKEGFAILPASTDS